MNIAFLTEIPFEGMWPNDFPNARTEICWMLALNAYHYNINDFLKVKRFDHVFVIIPKGKVFLSADGSKITDENNPISNLLESNFIEILKNNNKKVYFIQEGGVDRHINDYTIEDQFNYYSQLTKFDIIFSHNEYDKLFYCGILQNTIKVEVMPSLMFEHLIGHIKWTPQNKIMLGGNFSHFYRGMQSYLMIRDISDHSLWTMTSHSKRVGEEYIENLHHLPRLNWVDWMEKLSTFKSGIHLMDLRAAGTFFLNCGYFGIVSIGNKLVDTSRLIYPDWCVDVYNLNQVFEKVSYLKENINDKKWLISESEKAKENYRRHFSKEVYLEKLNRILT